jgi:hypothetical protein
LPDRILYELVASLLIFRQLFEQHCRIFPQVLSCEYKFGSSSFVGHLYLLQKVECEDVNGLSWSGKDCVFSDALILNRSLLRVNSQICAIFTPAQVLKPALLPAQQVPKNHLFSKAPKGFLYISWR